MRQPSLTISANPKTQDFLNVAGLPTFSSSCMVTPQISGLRNGDALAALAEAGVTCATGDNTWPFLLNQANPHLPLYTTAATNGYDGFAIIPRFATEIYYNCRWVLHAGPRSSLPASRLAQHRRGKSWPTLLPCVIQVAGLWTLLRGQSGFRPRF